MKETFEQEIEKGKWMFFIYSSPLPFPISFAAHTWIVTVSPDLKINRYEIHFFKNKKNKSHLYINYQEPNSWIWKLIWNKHPRYKANLLFKTSGNNNSLAQKAVKFIENNVNFYKFKNFYRHIPWPNSNTFTQWILDKFPEIKIKLPWNAFGKNQKIKSKCPPNYKR